jgi:uncharacterized protein (TIGR00251 family)
MSCHRVVPGGIVVSLRLTPRAGHDSLDGIGRLSDGSDVAIAHVRALPAEGAANKALIAILAKALRVPKSAVKIVAGASARLKQIRIAGDAPLLSGKIAGLPRIL